MPVILVLPSQFGLMTKCENYRLGGCSPTAVVKALSRDSEGMRVQIQRETIVYRWI